jgi:hypothetical protein
MDVSTADGRITIPISQLCKSKLLLRLTHETEAAGAVPLPYSTAAVRAWTGPEESDKLGPAILLETLQVWQALCIWPDAFYKV